MLFTIFSFRLDKTQVYRKSNFVPKGHPACTIACRLRRIWHHNWRYVFIRCSETKAESIFKIVLLALSIIPSGWSLAFGDLVFWISKIWHMSWNSLYQLLQSYTLCSLYYYLILHHYWNSKDFPRMILLGCGLAFVTTLFIAPTLPHVFYPILCLLNATNLL